MVLDTRMVSLSQVSIRVQVSVYTPPQVLAVPVITDMTLPLSRQRPERLLEYCNAVGCGGCVGKQAKVIF